MSIADPLAPEPRAGHEFATLGGGCFWCLEAVFEELEGVRDLECGYSGGHVADPGYRRVCEGDTGHAEVVRIEFDPARLAYRDLLEVYFAIHDPTTPDRQGNDVGSQYRSVIYTHSPAQQAVAREVLREVQQRHAAPVVTEVRPAPAYWRAEVEHQQYFRRHPHQGYCAVVIAPKVGHFRSAFAARRKRAAPAG
jgi:peptide-methionine (S)-S-oxide reductase